MYCLNLGWVRLIADTGIPTVGKVIVSIIIFPLLVLTFIYPRKFWLGRFVNPRYKEWPERRKKVLDWEIRITCIMGGIFLILILCGVI